MTTIPPSQKRDPNTELPLSEEMQGSIYPPQHEFNIAEGGEFLDDALRMKEQPLEQTAATKNEQPFDD